MSDIRTVLVTDNRIGDISSDAVIAVQSGAANNTLQSFQAVSTSNSSIIFNSQIPSESVIIDREVLVRTDITFTLTIRNVDAGGQAFNYGVDSALHCFPLNSLFQTVTLSINNSSTSINLQDCLPAFMRMCDPRELTKYNGMTPTLADMFYLQYADGTSSANNVLAGYTSNTYDNELMGRGAFPLKSATLSQYNSSGTYVSSSPICATDGNYFTVDITVNVTEPLIGLSPLVFGKSDLNSAGMVGINTLNMQISIDTSAKRLFSTANPDITIALGNSSNSNPFQNTEMLLNFLSVQPTQLVPSRTVLPYMSYPRYLSTSSTAAQVNPNTSTTLNSNNIQLNQIPDAFIIMVRQPMSSMTIQDSDWFFTINSISINFNNASGLLSSANQQQLWQISKDNGSYQSWLEFSGIAYEASSSTGVGTQTFTPGSMLILNPSKDLSLPPYLSSGGSIGQYNFQFNINVTNYGDDAIQPEICVICCNSGIFTTQAGSSVINTALLNKSMVLDAQEKKGGENSISTAEHTRLVGGNFNNKAGTALKKIAQRLLGKRISGGAVSGGAISGGSQDKLSKYY
jgi:hypothetical protein